MGFGEAFGQGFSSFFSIWQVCILQITPFFLAFAASLYFAGHAPRVPAGLGGRVFMPSVSFASGFALFYALQTMTGLPVGRVLSYNLGTLGFISGLYILLVSLTLLLSRHAVFPRRVLGYPFALGVLSLLLGVSFALVYSPCITPALSDILSMTSRPETAVRGGLLAFFYSLGICLGLAVSAVALVLVSRKVGAVARNAGLVKDVCALVLAVLGGLNVTGLMVYYKAFFLGFLVS